MQSKLLKDISSRTVQVVLNQVLGLFVFMIVSRLFDKGIYGEMNWSFSLLTFITTILSLRIEQLVVRNVAAGKDASKMLTLYGAHILFSGLFFYLILIAGSLVFPGFFKQHNLLLLIGISHLLSFFTSPYKQVANGKEAYGSLALMSTISIVVRSLWIIGIVIFSSLQIQQLILVYIITSLIELLVCMYLMKYSLRIPIDPGATLTQFAALIRECFPQMGIVFLNVCIGKLDIVLLGFFSTQIITAEYSFAYKIFQLLPFPLLIIGPVLVTRFSSYFGKNGKEALMDRKEELERLIRIEMVLGTLFPLALNLVWSPLIDAFTGHKYGASNEITFLLLSFCIPIQYLINLFWTIHFSMDHLGLIFKITAITCFMILIGDFTMIPVMTAHGAAIVYLIAISIQYLIYVRHTGFASSRASITSLLVCTGAALGSGLVVQRLPLSIVIKSGVALLLYTFLILIAKQLRRSDWEYCKKLLIK